jgi:hypothetical protein
MRNRPRNYFVRLKSQGARSVAIWNELGRALAVGNSIVRKVISASVDFSEWLLACRGCGRFTGRAAVAGAANGDTLEPAASSCLASGEETSALATRTLLSLRRLG